MASALLYLLYSVCSLFLCSAESNSGARYDCSTVSVNESLSLQQALDTVLKKDNTNSNCTTINLPVGSHVLSTQIRIPAELKGLELIGSWLGHVSVVCSYSVETDYTWYFSELSSLRIRNVHFHDCPRPLRVDTVAELEITNCSFRYFSEAALDIFNCHHSVFTNVTLEHNRGSGILPISYRGNTGGVSFGYNNLPSHFNSPSLYISNSVFRYNNATADSAYLTSSQAFARRVFTGRGGALAVFCNESKASLNVTLTDCIFEGNSARSFGGAVYLLPGGAKTNHNMLLQRSTFNSNQAGICGGGVQVTYPTTGSRDNPHLITVIDCNITNNSAHFNGGGMYISSITHGDGNSVDIRDSVFTDNSALYGGALVLKSFAFFLNSATIPYHQVSNCKFIGNSGLSGVVSAWFVYASFSGINELVENNGNALQVIGSIVHLSGEIHFVNNKGGEDSALHLLSFSQAVLGTGLLINFKGNSGRFGAGIYVDNQYDTSIVYNRSAACFLRYDMDRAPKEWNDIVVQFSDNHAVLASNLYMSRLDRRVCSAQFFYATKYSRNGLDIIDWPIWKFGDSNVNTGYAEPTNPQWGMQTTAERLTTPNTTVKVWPGFRFNINMEGLDDYDNPTTTIARLIFSPFNETENIVVNFYPEVIVVTPDPISGLLTRQFTVFYEVTNTSIHFIDRPLGKVELQVLDTTAIEVESAGFILEGKVCPAGYILQQTDDSPSVCICNDDISDVLLCKDDQETVVIKNGKWAVFNPKKEKENIQFYTCPSGYCRCRHDITISNNTCIYSYSHTDPDLQCTCDRKGILCGQCRNTEKGVTVLLNKCASCSKASVLIILALVVIDVIVFAVLTLMDIPLPSWIYPFIFYVQIAPIVGLYFPHSFNRIGKYLYFIGSASGFYFAYDFCVYDAMSSEVAYLLRFLPLLLAILTCTTILVCRPKFVKSKRKALNTHGVWWVLLLTYSHAVYASLTVLNCPFITDSNGATSPHWHVNGEVTCFTGGHIVLALLSLLVLLAAIAILPLCVLLSLGHVHKFPSSVRAFHQSLTVRYRQEYRWWSSVELARRLLLLLFIVVFPDNEVVPLLILTLYTAVYGYVQPYKSKLSNITEAAVNINFLILLIFNATAFFHDDYLTFPPLAQLTNDTCSDSVHDIATVSWILMPFYYLPLGAFCVILIAALLAYIRRKTRSSDANGLEETLLSGENNDTHKVDYTKWSMDLATDGFLHLVTEPADDIPLADQN